MLHVSLEPLGAILGSPWGLLKYLGFILDATWSHLGVIWGHLGAFLRLRFRRKAVLRAITVALSAFPLGSLSGHSRSPFDVFGTVLGPSWGHRLPLHTSLLTAVLKCESLF